MPLRRARPAAGPPAVSRRSGCGQPHCPSWTHASVGGAAVTDPNELAERYVRLWNEPDAVARRRMVDELFAADGTHVDQQADVTGRAAIADLVGRRHRRFVLTDGFAFRSRRNADGFRNVVRFNWELLPAATGRVRAVGLDLLTLDDDGQIRMDYQFMQRAHPSADQLAEGTA
jgi:hypothetical protein